MNMTNAKTNQNIKSTTAIDQIGNPSSVITFQQLCAVKIIEPTNVMSNKMQNKGRRNSCHRESGKRELARFTIPKHKVRAIAKQINTKTTKVLSNL